jgi:hypothetical protein
MEAITEPKSKSFWQRRNWWKIGFFVALFAFEVAREVAVLGANAKAEPNVSFNLFRFQEYTSAAGVWRRTDDGGTMSPAIIALECNQAKGSCTMVDVGMNERSVFTPNISNFDAKFEPDSIAFVDDSATCVTLNFRIDLRLKKVNAIREAKTDQAKNQMCREMEKRIDLTLGDSPLRSGEAKDNNHFLPVFDLLKLVFSVF